MKSIIKKIIPEYLILAYHKINAYMASFYYGFPSKNIKIIGITGTKGKTTTANFIWSVLQSGNLKTGLIGTANIRIGDIERMNTYHMTMPSPWIIQKFFKEMKNADCKYIVMEVTSEGIKQSRHFGIDFYVGIFTNLSPEHLPSHNNSYDLYAETKRLFFKKLSNKEGCMLANDDDAKSDYMSSICNVPVIKYGIKKGEWKATITSESENGVDFTVSDQQFHTPILGGFNVYNILPAIILGQKEGLDFQTIKNGILNLKMIPGRMEIIKENQPFTVIVDYAHERSSMQALVDAALAIKKPDTKLIVLYGAEGGGRDKRKRWEMSEVVSKDVEIVIVTATDPYDESLEKINSEIGKYLTEYGMKINESYFIIDDRMEAIKKALSLAKKDDIVMITGKGAEQSMLLAHGHTIPWDDRVITRNLLTELGYGK